MPSNPHCPNVLVTDEEKKALEERYKIAKESFAQKNGSTETLKSFEEAIKKDSCIVINLKVRILYRLVEEGQEYQTRHQLGEVELKRLEIDQRLFGDCGKEIRYAALSLDGWGLSAWGPCTICLQEERMQNRVSLLEENTYKFVDKHPYSGGETYPPPGYRASWQERHELAIAKLFSKIQVGMQKEDFVPVVLDKPDSRTEADFIEVYICGSFAQDAIKHAGIMEEPTDAIDKAFISVIQKRLLGSNKWKGMKKTA